MLSRIFRMTWRGGCVRRLRQAKGKLIMVGLLAGRLAVMGKSCRTCHPRLVSTSTNHPPAPWHGSAYRNGSSLALKVPTHAVSSKSLSPWSPIQQLDTCPYVGFSFNSLFFGHTNSILNEANEKITMHDSVPPPRST